MFGKFIAVFPTIGKTGGTLAYFFQGLETETLRGSAKVCLYL